MVLNEMVFVLARFVSSTSTAKAENEYEYEKPEQTGVHGPLNQKVQLQNVRVGLGWEPNVQLSNA